MKFEWNSRLVGVVIGVLGPLLIILGINVYEYPDMGYFEFIKHSIAVKTIGTWLKPAIIFNLAPFALCINTKYMRVAQGIVFATIGYSLYVAYLTFS